MAKGNLHLDLSVTVSIFLSSFVPHSVDCRVLKMCIAEHCFFTNDAVIDTVILGHLNILVAYSLKKNFKTLFFSIPFF